MQFDKLLLCCFFCMTTINLTAFQKTITFEKQYELALFGDDNDQAADIIQEGKHILVSGWSYPSTTTKTLSAILRLDQTGKQVKTLYAKGDREKIINMISAPNDILYWFGTNEESETLIVTKVKQSTLTLEKKVSFKDYDGVYGHYDLYGFLNKDNQLTIIYESKNHIQIVILDENLNELQYKRVPLNSIKTGAKWWLRSVLYEAATNQVLLALATQNYTEESTVIICKYSFGESNSLNKFFESKLTFKPSKLIKTPNGYTIASMQRTSYANHDHEMALIHLSRDGKKAEYQVLKNKKHDSLEDIIQSDQYTFLIGLTENFQHVLSTDDKTKPWVDRGQSPVVIALNQSGDIVGRYLLDSKIVKYSNQFTKGVLINNNQLIVVGASDNQWLISSLSIK